MDSKYAQYKDTLLQNMHFTENLRQRYKDIAYSAQTWANWFELSGILCIFAGILLASFLFIDANNQILFVLIKVFLFIGFSTCVIFSLVFYHKGKKHLISLVYHSYVVNSIISNQVHNDQMRSISFTRERLKNNHITIDHSIQLIKYGENVENSIQLLEKASRNISDLVTSLYEIERQSQYPELLLNDFHFSKAIYEYTHRN